MRESSNNHPARSGDLPSSDNEISKFHTNSKMMNALQILGIRSQNENLAHRKIPPQFMMELYNTIADPSGVTRGRNPYNARIVRSFVERGNSFSI